MIPLTKMAKRNQLPIPGVRIDPALGGTGRFASFWHSKRVESLRKSTHAYDTFKGAHLLKASLVPAAESGAGSSFASSSPAKAAAALAATAAALSAAAAPPLDSCRGMYSVTCQVDY